MGAAGEARQKAAIIGFHQILDPGETLRRQKGGADTGFGRPSGMQAFDHGAFLGGHQPGAKRTGDADGVEQGGAVESQHFTGGDRRRDGPCGALRVKPA